MKEIIPFIKIARALKDNHLWLCEPFSRGQAWVDLVLLANYSEGFFFIRGAKIDLERGQWAGSMEFLGERWKWSRTKVKTFLKVLQTEQQINLEITNIITKLTILNYNKFQDNHQKSTADCKAEIHQKYSRSTAEKHTQKKNKEEEEEKELSTGQKKRIKKIMSSEDFIAEGKTPVKLPDGTISQKVFLTADQKEKLVLAFKKQFGLDCFGEYLQLAIQKLDNYITNHKKGQEYVDHYKVVLDWPLEKAIQKFNLDQQQRGHNERRLKNL
jgi:hypothetical protein